MKKSVYTICGMCTVRCPIRVESEDNQITWIEGNQHLLGGASVPRVRQDRHCSKTMNGRSSR